MPRLPERRKASGFNDMRGTGKARPPWIGRAAQAINGAGRGALVVLASAICIAGCESPGSVPSSTAAGTPRPSYNLSGYSPAFKDGYTDACSTPLRRNAERFKSDADYSMGWNDGQSVCRAR
jgi:hypothetical protein